MAARSETSDDVLDLAFGAGPKRAVLAEAERLLTARRTGAPDVPAATRLALATATGSPVALGHAWDTALAIAEAVERHGAAFPPGAEPAYHDRHHQAEATIAMGWLAGAARRLGLLDGPQAELAVAAMAAHDLLHDGRVHAERGVLERRSAQAAAGIAAARGLEAARVEELRRIVLATTWPWSEAEGLGLSCHLAREADLFGSTLPRLGPRLSRLLAVELAMAGQPSPEGIAGHAARVALLRILPPASAPAQALGLDAARGAQIAAYEGAARRLGIAPPTPEAGAAALDAMDMADAEALLAWAGCEP
jgi:hypothetical protein